MQITVEYSRAFVCKTERRVWRGHAWPWLFWSAVPAAALLLDWLAAGRAPDLGHDFACGALAGVTGALLLSLWLSYAQNRKDIAWVERKVGEQTVTYGFTPEGLVITSSLGSQLRPWSRFDAVWMDRDAWYLFEGRYSYVAFPAGALTDEIRGCLVARLREAGVTHARM